MMELRRAAVCSPLSTEQVDGLHCNHMFVTGGKKTRRRVGLFEQGLWRSARSLDLLSHESVVVVAAGNTHSFLKRTEHVHKWQYWKINHMFSLMLCVKCTVGFSVNELRLIWHGSRRREKCVVHLVAGQPLWHGAQLWRRMLLV